MTPLKPCPFCGAKVQYSRIPGQGLSVLCGNCGALAIHSTGGSQQALAEGWNRRTVRHNFSVQSKLKPCPFCASRLSLGSMDNAGAILKCASCGMIVSFALSDDLQHSIAQWNRRV